MERELTQKLFTHERELLALVVICLKLWRHHLLGPKVTQARARKVTGVEDAVLTLL